jgi:hypothetical protein
MLGALPDERTCLSFTIVSGSRQRSLSPVRVPLDSWPYFTVLDFRQPEGPEPRIYIHHPENGGQLYPQALGSLFVASYDSHDYGGGIRPRLHTGISFFRPGTDRTENISSIVACFLFVTETTTCPQSYSLATAVVLSPVYIAVT